MEFKSINPYNGQTVATYKAHTRAEVLAIIEKSNRAFQSWRQVAVEERARLMAKAGEVLRQNVEEYARMITLEMGKPMAESRAEINKCAWACDYYAENAQGFLADEVIATEARMSFVRHDPLGTVLAIMPWNFPFWQVFRFAAPSLTAGNTGILKHAPNVFGCATQIAEVFRKAGFPEGVFQNLLIGTDNIEEVIGHDLVRAVTLTGSERAGRSVAAVAGKYLKKCVLELGGSNGFIVLEDADIEDTVRTALTARMMNSGQSCIAAKRFIIVESLYDQFVARYVAAVKKLKAGDPLDESTTVGPLARKDLADQLQRQVQESVASGARLLLGGKQQECFHEPTILGGVMPGMAAFDEETFGPLAPMIKARDEAHALELAAMSKFGLGTTVCTTNIDKALSFAADISDGAYFVNELVKSDPRLPFGGTKSSGYGRELARNGMTEFVNVKTVFVK